MQKIIACVICILALLTIAMPAIIAEDNQNSTGNITLNQTQNATGNISQNQSISPGIAQNLTQNQNTTPRGAQNTNQPARVLRAGFEKTKPLNNLDVYGNKSTYSIPASNMSSAFDLSQRGGNISRFVYNTDIYKPVYNVSQYRRTKPAYEVPSTPAKPVYSISGYPVIKAANSIP